MKWQEQVSVEAADRHVCRSPPPPPPSFRARGTEGGLGLLRIFEMLWGERVPGICVLQWRGADRVCQLELWRCRHGCRVSLLFLSGLLF